MHSCDLTADASSVINLVNSGLAETALRNLPSATRVTPQVVKETEVKNETSAAIANLIEKEFLACEEELITFAELEELIFSSALGAGECETILSCMKTGRVVCCDDKKARNLTKKMLGAEKLIGTIGLLKCHVKHGKITTKQAYCAYEKMRNTGGFLPKLNSSFFES